MISISKEELKFNANEKGYRPEILEKVYRLLGLLETFVAVPFLRERLVLKGGTAINLFFSSSLPRLSLDLDFNYISSVDRETMLLEKKELKQIILDLCYPHNYELYRNPGYHAGGKMILSYPSLLGQKGRLELDLNFLYRRPLWKPTIGFSPDWPKKIGVPILNIHELAAGKLHALLERDASRDLFDSHQLLTHWPLDQSKLRLAFTVYAGMRKASWKKLDINQIQFNLEDIRNKLLPVLQQKLIPGTKSSEIKFWAEKLVAQSKEAFANLLPFNEPESDFLECLENKGQIKPELLSTDSSFCEAVKSHPALLWRATKA